MLCSVELMNRHQETLDFHHIFFLRMKVLQFKLKMPKIISHEFIFLKENNCLLGFDFIDSVNLPLCLIFTSAQNDTIVALDS